MMATDYTKAPEQDVVLQSRVRLARNFDDLPFSPKLSPESAEDVIRRAQDVVQEGAAARVYATIRLRDMDADGRGRLLEHDLANRAVVKSGDRSAVLVSSGSTISVMLNGEEHIVIQGKLPGLQPDRSAQLAYGVDEKLSRKYGFAFENERGYLTASPMNTGTGMRTCVILHLPALARAGRIGEVMQEMGKLGLSIRGTYGDGREAGGHLYQLFNQATLGRSEEDVLTSITAAAEEIVGHERATREQAEKQDMMRLEDMLLRSYGEAVNARLMNGKELLRRWSDVRYAASMGYLHMPLAGLDLLLQDLQPASLAADQGKLLSPREADIVRAKEFRERLLRLTSEYTE